MSTRRPNRRGPAADSPPDTRLNLRYAEIAEATKQIENAVTIIASPALAQRYADALRLLGRDSTLAPDDCVAGGHWRIARAAGLC